MIEMLNIMITHCLDETTCLNSAEIEFINRIDESMTWPEQKDIQQLKRLWNKVNDAREAA